MTPESPPLLHSCYSCGALLESDHAFFRFLGSPRPLASCAECARWQTEQFTAAACILEAQQLVRAHHALLNRQEARDG